MLALDTNTVIYFFKGQGRVADHLADTPPTEIVIPSAVLYELEVGIAKSPSPTKRRRQLSRLLDTVSVLPLGIPEARTAGLVRARLERAGTPIGPIDTLIAATALHHGATLVTRNLDEFQRVEGLALVNWFD